MPTYELVTKPTADNLQLETNPSYLAAAATKDSSLNHYYDVILSSDDVRAKKK